MSSQGKKDRLSPPLMLAFRSAHQAHDAKTRIDLRSDDGERVIAGRRVTGRAPISEILLRREVARDLEVLMNTVAFESSEDIVDLTHVRNSVLNFGFPDIAHRSIGEISIDELNTEICAALIRYEPRLARQTIRARRDASADAAALKLRFIVHADLKCEPLNVPVEFVADVDIESGGIKIERL